MTDPLTDLLTQALAHNHGPSYWPDLHDVTIIGETPEDCAVKLLAAIDPAKADAMRAGLLLGEVERLLPEAAYLRMWTPPTYLDYTIDVVGIGDPGNNLAIGGGPTLLAALTDLLAKLRVQP